MKYQVGSTARQLALHYLDGSGNDPQVAQTVQVPRPSQCAICQTRQVMVDRRRPGKTDLFHTLCFRCYHEQMQHKRMAKRRRSMAKIRAATADLESHASANTVAPTEPKYRALAHRRHRAQMVARRELAEAERDQRTNLAAVAATLAGRV